MTKNILSLILGGFSILLLWQFAHFAIGGQDLILPSPFAVLEEMLAHWRHLLFHAAVTMLESLCGFVLGVSVAYSVAVGFTFSTWVRDAVYPYAVALKATPIVVLAPLVSVWTGGGFLSKALLASLVCFFPVLVASFRGLSAFDKESLLLLESYGATKAQALWYLRIPASLPITFASLKIASTLAVVGAVIGELTGSENGIGFVVNTAVYYLDMDLALAAVSTVSACGILLFALISALERRLLPWAPEHRGEN